MRRPQFATLMTFSKLMWYHTKIKHLIQEIKNHHFTNWWHLSQFPWTTAFTRTFATSILRCYNFNGMIKWYDFSCATLYLVFNILAFWPCATAPSGPSPSHCRGFMITLRHTTLGRTPLDEWFSPTHWHVPDTHNRQTSMPPAGFESTIPAIERLQTHSFYRATTGTGQHPYLGN